MRYTRKAFMHRENRVFGMLPGRGILPGPILGISIVMATLAGCASTPEPLSPMDNAWRHYARGMELLEEGKREIASSKFERALHLDEDFSPALSGKSLIVAMRAATQTEEAHRKADRDTALDLLKEAKGEADGPRERFIHHVTAIRVLTASKPGGWLGKARGHHQDALAVDELDETRLPYYRDRGSADYFMAVAWFGEDFRKSEPLLKKVLGSRKEGKWVGKADALYARVQRISRAAAHHTPSGEALRIAVLEQVSRGDVAALLVSELELDSLFAGRIPVKSRIGKAEFTPADMLVHPFRDEIGIIMKWNVRGLEPRYDAVTRAYLFRPRATISRKELAFVLEDVLVKLLNNERLPTEHVGQRSSFQDVPADAAWFNAIMTVTTRGLMEADLSGEFRPDDPVDGAELLLAIFKLRNVMNIH